MFSLSAHLLLADTCTSMDLLLARCHIDCGTCCRLFAPPVADDRMILESRSFCACFSLIWTSVKVFRLPSPLKAFGLVRSHEQPTKKSFYIDVFNLPAGISLVASRNFCAKFPVATGASSRKLHRVSPPVADHWILVQSKISWCSCWFHLAWTSSDFLSRPRMVSVAWCSKLGKQPAIIWFERRIACPEDCLQASRDFHEVLLLLGGIPGKSVSASSHYSLRGACSTWIYVSQRKLAATLFSVSAELDWIQKTMSQVNATHQDSSDCRRRVRHLRLICLKSHCAVARWHSRKNSLQTRRMRDATGVLFATAGATFDCIARHPDSG